VQDISISGLALTGDLDLSGMTQLTSILCDNNDLTSIDVSDCDRLFILSCREASIITLDISNTAVLTVLDCEDNYLNLSDIINDIIIISIRENGWVSYINQKLLYDFTLTMPGLLYDKMSQMLTLDTIKFTAQGVVPESVFIEVNMIDELNGNTNICSDTIILDTYGVGIYDISSLPIVIDMYNEQVEILVYTDDKRVQLITQLFIKPILFEF
jgi:hypothetical protein